MSNLAWERDPFAADIELHSAKVCWGSAFVKVKEMSPLGVTTKGRGEDGVFISGLGGVRWDPVGEAGLPAEVPDK